MKTREQVAEFWRGRAKALEAIPPGSIPMEVFTGFADSLRLCVSHFESVPQFGTWVTDPEVRPDDKVHVIVFGCYEELQKPHAQEGWLDTHKGELGLWIASECDPNGENMIIKHVKGWMPLPDPIP